MLSRNIAALAAFTTLAAIAELVLASSALAQNYPTKPMRMIVPFAAGGGSDITARLLADSIGPVLKQIVVIDNRGGAGSVLGTDIASKALPDGYTIMLGNISMAFNAALYRKLPYDALRDLAPVSLATDQPSILITPPSVPAKTLQKFIALARAQPGKLTYASAGLGAGTHLAMEMLALSQNLSMVHVPYKGTGPALTAMLGNEVSSFLSTFASALPHVKANRLRGIAVTSLKRAPTLPEVPTVAESDMPGFRYSTWYGVLAPAATPKPIIDKLNKTIVDVLQTPAMQQRYANQGMDAMPTSSAEFARFFREETQKWGKVVRDAKIPPQ